MESAQYQFLGANTVVDAENDAYGDLEGFDDDLDNDDNYAGGSYSSAAEKTRPAPPNTDLKIKIKFGQKDKEQQQQLTASQKAAKPPGKKAKSPEPKPPSVAGKKKPQPPKPAQGKGAGKRLPQKKGPTPSSVTPTPPATTRRPPTPKQEPSPLPQTESTDGAPPVFMQFPNFCSDKHIYFQRACGKVLPHVPLVHWNDAEWQSLRGDLVTIKNDITTFKGMLEKQIIFLHSVTNTTPDTKLEAYAPMSARTKTYLPYSFQWYRGACCRKESYS